MDALPLGIVVWTSRGTLDYGNPRAAEIVGKSLSSGDTPAAVMAAMFHAGTNQRFPPELVVSDRVFRGETLAFQRAELVHENGERRAVEGWTVPILDGSGPVERAVTTLVDVTEARRAESLRDGEARVLELVAADTPLEETLVTLARVFEAQADGMLASILLVEDGRIVRHAAAPSLPREWQALVDGQPIGPDRGSCGTAAHLKQPVIVTDIATDPRWERYRDAALAFGLRACWSTPILDHAGDVLGTFAFYYTEARAPTPRLLELAAHASRLATVAIQHGLRKAAARRAEEELHVNQRHLSLVYDHVADVLYQLRIEGDRHRFVSANPAFYAATGLRPDQVSGKLAEDVFPEPALSAMVERWREAVRTRRTVRWEETANHAAGPRRNDVAIVPVFDDAGAATYLIGSVRDITERHRELTERLRMATRGARIGIWCWDVRDDRLEWDEQMYVLYGLAPDAGELRYDEWRRAVHPEDRARVEAALQAALRGEAAFDTEFRVLWPDGTLRHVKVNAVVQNGTDGAPLRMIGTNWDITAAKLAKEDLRKAKEASEAATRAKALFLANMSHEIRTPMHAILGYAQLLRKASSLDEEQRRSVEVIHSSGQHLLTIINDVLEMATIEAGRSTVVARPLDLGALLGDLETLFGALASEKGLRLELELGPDLARNVVGDALKIRQVVVNLLSNALKFTDHGRIGVRAHSTPLSSERATIVIAVEDTGRGIAASDVERIFRPFDQSTTGDRAPGTGLGLAICKSFARMLKGDVRVQSTLGSGSTFVFSFEADVVTDAQAPPARSPEQAQRPDDGATVRAAAGFDREALARLAATLPRSLVEELRNAALEARAARIADLTRKVRLHSAEAAAQLEELARSFQYEIIVRALETGKDQ